MSDQPPKKHSPLPVIVHMLVHAVAGIVMFAIVAIPAIILNFAVAYLAAQGTDKFILRVLTFVEYAILVGDAALYLALVAKSLWKAAKELDL